MMATLPTWQNNPASAQNNVAPAPNSLASAQNPILSQQPGVAHSGGIVNAAISQFKKDPCVQCAATVAVIGGIVTMALAIMGYFSPDDPSDPPIYVGN